MASRIFTPATVLRFMSYWPPYFWTGISIQGYDAELTRVDVRLKSSPWNANLFGTHFGGSLYSMCDPFYMFILLHHLGKDHIVWDKAARIDFVKAVRGPVTARFEIPRQRIDVIRAEALTRFSLQPTFSTQVVDAEGAVVAEVEKVLYVRRKDAKERFGGGKGSLTG